MAERWSEHDLVHLEERCSEHGAERAARACALMAVVALSMRRRADGGVRVSTPCEGMPFCGRAKSSAHPRQPVTYLGFSAVLTIFE